MGSLRTPVRSTNTTIKGCLKAPETPYIRSLEKFCTSFFGDWGRRGYLLKTKNTFTTASTWYNKYLAIRWLKQELMSLITCLKREHYTFKKARRDIFFPLKKMYHYNQGCGYNNQAPYFVNLLKCFFAMVWVAIWPGLSCYHQYLFSTIYKMSTLVTVQLTCLHHQIHYPEFSLSEIYFDQEVNALKQISPG